MSARPDVSVIVPCYNSAQTVAETLASIQAQTHANWEAICVDDESTDSTPELLETLTRADPRIRWLRVSLGGLAATRNRAIPHATAPRAICLDADDLLRPDALETVLAASRMAGDTAVIGGGYELLDERGRPLSVFRLPTVPEFSVDALLRGNRLTSTTLIPKTLLEQQPFDESVPGCEDWDLWLRLADAGVGCVALPRVLFGYRQRAGSLSRRTDLMFDSGRRVLERWMPRARNPEAAGDALFRWACTTGAFAFASGTRRAIRRYFDCLPPLEPSDDFNLTAAHSIYAALLAVRGVTGETWSGHADRWIAEVEEWLAEGPLARRAAGILRCLARVRHNSQDRLPALRSFLAETRASRLVIYGLGTNGSILLEQLRADAGDGSCELCVADDHADPLTLAALNLPRDDPRHWRSWPRDTVVAITPNECEAMRATLAKAGGREGVDFVVLATCAEAVGVSAT